MKKVRFTLVASKEVIAAAEWYEEQSQGLGAKFLDRVEEAVDKIALNPLGYAIVVEDVRRCMVPRFQDALWFRAEPDESIVIACLHGKRDVTLAKERARGIIEIPGKGAEPN